MQFHCGVHVNTQGQPVRIGNRHCTQLLALHAIMYGYKPSHFDGDFDGDD